MARGLRECLHQFLDVDRGYRDVRFFRGTGRYKHQQRLASFGRFRFSWQSPLLPSKRCIKRKNLYDPTNPEFHHSSTTSSEANAGGMIRNRDILLLGVLGTCESSNPSHARRPCRIPGCLPAIFLSIAGQHQWSSRSGDADFLSREIAFRRTVSTPQAWPWHGFIRRLMLLDRTVPNYRAVGKLETAADAFGFRLRSSAESAERGISGIPVQSRHDGRPIQSAKRNNESAVVRRSGCTANPHAPVEQHACVLACSRFINCVSRWVI